MAIYRTFCLLALVTLATAAQAQTLTLSAKPLAEALQNQQLTLPEEDPLTAPARKRVTDLLLNQPSDAERAKFHARLADFARHKDTRLGRLFFTALAGCPDLENVDPKTESASITAQFALELGSGARVRLAWQRKDESFLVSEFAVEITGNAGALFAAAAPYFSPAQIDTRLLDAAELDFLLGRDTRDRMRLESERTKFDFAASLASHFELEAGAPATLLADLGKALAGRSTPAEKIAALSPHLAGKQAREELARVGVKPEYWDAVEKQLAALSGQPRPSAAPKRRDGVIETAWRLDDADHAWQVARLSDGKLSLRGGVIGAQREESN